MYHIIWNLAVPLFLNTLDSPIYMSLPMCPPWEVRDVDSENEGINISVSHELAAELAKARPAVCHTALAFTRMRSNSCSDTDSLTAALRLLYCVLVCMAKIRNVIIGVLVGLLIILAVLISNLRNSSSTIIVNCLIKTEINSTAAQKSYLLS